jgi:hypothetical protein
MYALVLLFDVTDTVLALFLKFGHRLLLKVLKARNQSANAIIG